MTKFDKKSIRRKYLLTSFIVFFILLLALIDNASNTKTINIERNKVYDGNTYKVYNLLYDYKGYGGAPVIDEKFARNVGETFTWAPSYAAYDLTQYIDLSNKLSFHYFDGSVTNKNYRIKNTLYSYFIVYEEKQANQYYDFSIVDANGNTRYYYIDKRSGRWADINVTSALFDPRVYGADYEPQNNDKIYIHSYYTLDYVEGGDLPTAPEVDGYYFSGWFNDLNQRVNYLNVYDQSNYYSSYMMNNAHRNLYAKYRSTDELICKRGIKLHTETCERDSGGCYDSGYYDEGSKNTTTITYGQKGISGELHPGDIFTCDVNNDGIYDEDTERFYYMNDYYNTQTKSFETDKAVLVYYSNTTLEGPTNSSNKSYYYISKDTQSSPFYPFNQFMYCSSHNSYGKCDNYSDYEYVMSGFPYRWQTYLINNTRYMYNVYDNSVNYNGGTRNYTQNSSAARLLAVKEFKDVCGISFGYNYAVNGNFDNCNFLLENTSYADSNVTAKSYWIEDPYDYAYTMQSHGWTVDGDTRTLKGIDTEEKSGSRPVIEMFKTNMEIDFDTTNHNVTIDNNDPITVAHETEYILPSVPSKADENVDVTLSYTLDNTITQTAYTRQYVADGWLVNGSGYNDEIMEAGDTIVVSDDVTLTPRYVQVIIDNNFTFPSIPEISEYTATNVTFKYQDNETEDKIDNVKVSATAINWKSKKAIYSPGDTYDGNINMTFYPDYVYPGGALENPTREGYVFVGWYDADTNGNKITKNNLKSNMTLYAHWETLETGKKCVRPSDAIQEYHFDDYKNENDQWLFYGNAGTNGELNSGDILFCDVDGNGNYDGTGRVGGYHEEFYYVSDYYDTETKEFDSDTATLIGQNEYGTVSATYGEKYNATHSIRTPEKAVYSLINSNEWNKLTNINLKNSNRQLLSNNNTSKVKDTQGIIYDLDTIDYTGTNLRLLTYQELADACEIIDPYNQTFSDDYNQNVSLKHCNYLNQTFWLETQNADLSENALRVQNYHIDSQSNASSSVIRPTIDIDKDDIQMHFNDYEHTITIKNQYDEVVTEMGVQHGSYYDLGTNDYIFDTDGESTVTYVFQDGNREAVVYTYNRRHSNSGWKVNGTHANDYNDNRTIYITEDTIVEPNISYYTSGFYMPEPSKSGYRFDGWYTEPEGGELIDNVEDLVDRTLYAHWTRVYELYNYDGNYSQVEPGTVITLPEDDEGYNNFEYNYTYDFDYNYEGAPEPENFTVTSYGEFSGWSINGGDYESGDEYTIISDTEVRGVYKGILDDDTLPDIPERNGYTFIGWYTEPDGGNLIDLANMDDYILGLL